MSSNKRQKSEQEEVVIIYKQGVEVPKNVTKVIFDASVTEIPDSFYPEGVFSHCKQLREVVFNEGLQEIGWYAFIHCTSLERIKLPSTVTEVGYGSFYCCTNLREVLFNEGLQTILQSAFWDCTSLSIIKLPSTVTEVGICAFDNCINLREVVLNEGLQMIEEKAFGGCASLTIIKFPSTVTVIEENAFNNCKQLKEVVFNEGLQKIWRSAFWGCKSLSIIKLPSTVTEVGDHVHSMNAFYDCPSLTIIQFPSISKRAKNLIDFGITEMEDKITANQYFEWKGGEFLISPEAINFANWKATRTHLDRVLTWVSFYELREATSTIELALWKIKIEETRAATVEERDACRGEVPGPVKDAIIQYLEVNIGVDGN